MNTVPRIPSEGAIEAYAAGKRALEEAAEARSKAAEEVVKAREAKKAALRVGPGRSAAQVKQDVDDLFLSEAGASLFALVEIRDHPRTRAVDRIKAATEILERALGPVNQPAVTVNVDSSLMALARKLDAGGMEVVRARARGELEPGPSQPSE